MMAFYELEKRADWSVYHKYCRWVDEVIPDAPWVVTQEFLDKHKIDFVAHDSLHYADTSGAGKDVYEFVKAAGRFKETQRTDGISTSDIIMRIVKDYNQYVMHNLARGYTRKELNLSYVKEKGLRVNMRLKKLHEKVKEQQEKVLSIRDELFDTFRKRHKGVMEAEEVQLTANSLHRMLLTFCEQTNGQQCPENASDQELLEIVMARYEKELLHPIKSIVGGGELPRAMLIQVQKLKLDIETAMLELDQILKANDINFAVLAALPAFIFMVILIMLLRSWIKQDKGAEGRGRIARRQTRLLIVEIEKMIMQYQSCMDLRQIEDAQCCFGLVLYTLDHLYRAVQKHAKTTGEWSCLKQDIIDLAKPQLQTTHKLTITSRMERVYDCLLPSLGK